MRNRPRLPLAMAALGALAVLPAAAQSTIRTFAGGGPADGARAADVSLGNPGSVAADAAGNVYITAYHQNRVFRVTPGGTVTTVAGNGGRGYSGDGGPATATSLYNPYAVALDGSGSLYIADFLNYRVRKVSPAGVVTTLAGIGSHGYSGDGGPAVNAAMSAPTDVAVDGAGAVYIADFTNHRIRKITPDGVIHTVAGNGIQGYSGDGGPAVNASLNIPISVAVDSTGNLYISDRDNHRIRKVSAAGIITTVAGNGSAGYSGDGGQALGASLSAPRGLAVDGAGNVYFADSGNHRIRRLSTGGILTTVAGNGLRSFSGDGGPATSAGLHFPYDVAVTAAGILYIADTSNGRVRVVYASGVIGPFAGNGTTGFSGDDGLATAAQLAGAMGVAAGPGGAFYIGDTFNNRVRRVAPSGVITTVAGNGNAGCCLDGGLATGAPLNSPRGVAVDSAGTILVADTDNHRIRRIYPGGIITTVAGNGAQGAGGDGGVATNARLAKPEGVAVDASGAIYIADTENHRIRQVSPAGVITTLAGTGTKGYSGDGGPAASAMLDTPKGVAVDGAGNVYIADYLNGRIRKVSPSGGITTVAGGGTRTGDGGPATTTTLFLPTGVTLDAAGALFIAEQGNRVRRVSPAGVITTVAGNGDDGYSGDGGPATSASLAWPQGIAVDNAGTLYIAEWGNNRVRAVSPPPATCTYALERNTVTASAQGDRHSITVTTGPHCGWSAATGADWITFPTYNPGSGQRNPGAGQGRGELIFTVEQNQTPSSRTAAIQIEGLTLTVFQTPTVCSYALNPQSPPLVPAAGGAFSLGITTTPNCTWTPSAAPDWLTVDGAGRTGPGSLAYTLSANSASAPRTASITVGGKAVQVIQSGANPPLLFDDVPAAHPYFPHISLLRENAITSGCTSSAYCPDDTINRGQMAVFLVRALLGDAFDYLPEAAFNDVPPAHPYFKYIQKMSQLGVTSGCGSRTFCPDDPVTRGQMAVFLIRARLSFHSLFSAGLTPVVSLTPMFSDVPFNHPYYAYIQKMKDLGITSGCTATAYCPDAPVTRGQMSVFLVRGLLTP